MTATAMHPEPEKLKDFGLGRLTPEEAHAIEEHISACDDCCQTLLNLHDDTFVDLVRLAEAAPDMGGATNEDATLPASLVNHPRYQVMALLGRGGMGDVYKAQHRVMDRLVALKLINEKLIGNPQAVERFRREVQAAARLTHPNIVAAFDAEQSGDVHFLVMEYVDGIDLAEIVRQHGPLPIDEACRYIRQAAEGLQHAHERGMVHRDIKPQNLMLQRGQGPGDREQFSGSRPAVKILDFGLARFASEVVPAPGSSADAPATQGPEGRITAFGTMMGTPDYLAPEHSRDAQSADIRADIYALGCTLYFLLAGRPPFAAGSVLEKVKAHAQQEPQPLTELRADVPTDLEGIVRRMMAKHPAERYQTPSDVAAALVPFANPAPSGKSSRPPTRRRLVVATALALTLLVAVVLYVQIGKTTLRFEITDPRLSVRFGEQTIQIDNDGHTMHVKPGAEQRFVVEQDGLVLETDSLVLRRSQEIVLTIAIVQGDLQIAPSDITVQLDRRRGPALDADALQRQNAAKLGLPVRREYSLISLRLIPAGDFLCGSGAEQIRSLQPDESWFFARFVQQRREAEMPQHRVEITRPFYLGAHEVTVGQFRKFVEATGYITDAQRDRNGYGWRGDGWSEGPEFDWQKPGFEQTDEHPVCNVSWSDANAFCRWLDKTEGGTHRLPTEAEWEYACRSGTTTLFSTGDDVASLQGAANLADLSPHGVDAALPWAVAWNDGFRFTAPVGRYRPNAWGLHDMHGNVWEWCQDTYDESFYRSASTRDPQCTKKGSQVFRGGGFDNWPGFLRSADRYSSHSPTLRTEWAGFRVVREIPPATTLPREQQR